MTEEQRMMDSHSINYLARYESSLKTMDIEI